MSNAAPKPANDSSSKSAINMTFVSAFLESATKAVSTMAGVEVVPQAPKIKKGVAPLGDIAGIMPMAAPGLKGQLIVSFTTESIIALTSKMLREEFRVIDNEVRDMVGEITNIATGGAKALLEKQGFDFDMARPYVVEKAGYDGLDLPDIRQIVIPHRTDCGPIFIELGFVHT